MKIAETYLSLDGSFHSSLDRCAACDLVYELPVKYKPGTSGSLNSSEKIINFSEALGIIENIDIIERVFEEYKKFKNELVLRQ